jgi:hypothetical protein
MEYTVQVIIERAARFRRQLAELERSVEPGKEIPEEQWQEIQKFSAALEREVRKAQGACRVMAKQVNETRQAIIETLDNYNHWREQMRQVEDLFLTYVVRPGLRLRQAVHQREQLESDYHRMRRNVEIEHYESIDELKDEIINVLKVDDASIDAQDEDLEDEGERETTIFDLMEEFDVERLVDEIEKESVVREYKRVVLPEIHPDTSNTPAETFKTVYEVYEKRDYLLMEAYVVQYRGDIVPDPVEDPLLVLNEIDQYQENYTSIETRLEDRMERLQKELTPQELDDPEKLKQTLRSQQAEINARIQEEAEQILQLRQKIESLLEYYLDYHA